MIMPFESGNSDAILLRYFDPQKLSLQPLHRCMQRLQTFFLRPTKKGQLCTIIHHLQRMKKTENDKKKSLARSLYLSGMEQAEIADKIGVTRVTISRWCSAEGWKEQRAAKNITRPELVNKLLLTIDKLIEQVHESDDPTLISGLGDKLAKLASVIDKLDKKANVVDTIESFMAFGRWLEYRAQTDKNLTPELIKLFNAYQDKYIVEMMSQ